MRMDIASILPSLERVWRSAAADMMAPLIWAQRAALIFFVSSNFLCRARVVCGVRSSLGRWGSVSIDGGGVRWSQLG